jgi:Rieske Fe-S protein
MTEEGRVAAADVVVATGLPIVDLGEFFARTTPKAHLVLGARVNGAAPSGMFISLDEPTHSMRWEERADGTWLVVVGPKFQPGSQDTVTGFAELEAFAREHFPVISVEHRWWNMDFYSVEGMPYVGPMTEETPHLYVATGFSGWGLTTGTVAARVIADAITGTESEWASTFRSTRPVISDESPIASAVGFVKENLVTAKAFVSDRLSPPVDLAALPPGSGVVTHIDGEQVAVSRDDDGRLHAVSAVCTHLGCVVDWNAAMRTWDCGCHGSCFTADGAVLRGPARHDLEARTEHIQ